MIDKADFYHGAALVRVIEDARCERIARHEQGYLVNGCAVVCIKYSTKARSPWQFTLTADDVENCGNAAAEGRQCVVAFVCGGDGICAVPWHEVDDLIAAKPGSGIAAKRAFNGCYSVSGPSGTLKRKVARNQWPGILFPED